MGADCKSVAKASQVRILHLPLLSKGQFYCGPAALWPGGPGVVTTSAFVVEVDDLGEILADRP